MNLPKITLESLPDMGTLTGIFGSADTPGFDDTIIVIMTYIYEVMPPDATGLF